MLSNLTSIPRIMRGLKWLNGAQLLDKWFSGKASVKPNYASPDTTTIRMNAWVLTFPRARELYDKLLKERIWANARAQAQVAAVLRRNGFFGSQSRSFGPRPGQSVPALDRDYINFRAIGETTDFDDMTAALAAFTLRVLVAGGVTPQLNGRAWDIVIQRVGIYVRDSFDFEGDQPLGCWSDNPDLFSPIVPPLGPSGIPAVTPVGNRDFREWRQRNGRGGDFEVFSDINWITLPVPDKFTVR